MSQKGFAPIIVILAILITGILVFEVYLKQKLDPLDKWSPTPTASQVIPSPSSTLTNAASDNTNYVKRIYNSPDSNYFFEVSESETIDKCNYSLISKNGSNYDLAKIINEHKIDCSVGMGMISSSFLGWISNDTFIIEEANGTIKSVQLPTLQVNTYEYDSTKYSFEAVNNDLTHWLFEKKNSAKDKSPFVILGKDKNIILDDLNFNQNDNEHVFSILFDQVNNGFLFTVRNYLPESQNTTFIKFEFLSLTNLKLRNILTTDPIEVQGRGCGGYDELYSRQGEIIVSIPCIYVGDKYLGLDRKIHIKL